MKNIFKAVAIIFPLVVTTNSAMAHQDNETPHGLFTIVKSYEHLKKQALDKNYYETLINLAKEYGPPGAANKIKNDRNLDHNNPTHRLSLAMRTIASGRYDQDHRAQRELAICTSYNAHVIFAQITAARKTLIWEKYGDRGLKMSKSFMKTIPNEHRTYIKQTQRLEILAKDNHDVFAKLKAETHDLQAAKNCPFIFQRYIP